MLVILLSPLTASGFSPSSTFIPNNFLSVCIPTRGRCGRSSTSCTTHDSRYTVATLTPPLFGAFAQLCHKANAIGRGATRDTLDAAYHLVSQLLRLFQPRQPIAAPSTRYALAVHARRGDKLFAKGRERIALPSADLLARTAIRLLGTIRRPAVLIASDDGPFASEFAQRLRRGAPGVRVEVQATNLSSHHQCDASCIPPLQALVVSFSRAGRLLVSLRSNMGGYLLASWSGLNGRSTPPPFVDLDGRVKDDALGDRYFCSLRWGSRAGLCAPGERFDRMASCTAQASPKVVECCANATAARVLQCRACPRTPPVCSARIYDRDA